MAKRSTVRPSTKRSTPERESLYPEPAMFGDLPSYGFFIRHVRGLQVRDVEVSYLSPEMRPAFWLNDVLNAEFIHVKAQKEADVPVFVLKNVSNFGLQQSWPLADQRLERVDSKKF